MDFGTRLQKYRKQKQLTQEQLAAKVGVAKTTIAGYERGNREPDVEKIKKLSAALGISGDELIGNITIEKAPPYSGEAMKIAKDYDLLDVWGKRAVRTVTDNELARIEDEKRFLKNAEAPKESKIIPLYLTPAAAGYASPVFGEDFEPLELTDSDPRGAEFAVKISGDSMEPYIHDGSHIFCNRDPLADGDVGIFYVDGDMLCKQYHKDNFGIVYLFSLNRDRADADVVLTAGSGRSLVCFGRVITAHRYPLPR